MLGGMQQMRPAVVVRASRHVDNLTCGSCGLVRMWFPFVAEMCPPSETSPPQKGD